MLFALLVQHGALVHTLRTGTEMTIEQGSDAAVVTIRVPGHVLVQSLVSGGFEFVFAALLATTIVLSSLSAGWLSAWLRDFHRIGECWLDHRGKSWRPLRAEAPSRPGQR
jgi:hypothetical protein